MSPGFELTLKAAVETESIGKSKDVGKNLDLPDDSGDKRYKSDLPDDSGEGFGFRDTTDEEKNILKTVVGMTDANIEKCVVDVHGIIHLSCRNQDLEGSTHPVTDIVYKRRTVEINGVKIEGVFPTFESTTTYTLPDNLLKASERNQFAYLNQCLLNDIKSNPNLCSKFTEQDIAILSTGKNPPGFTWHHCEGCGKMQLVSTAIHAQTGHTGGDSIWCGR